MSGPGPGLAILTGPSCVGKSPLCKALGKMYPGLREGLSDVVLFNSRSPRPGERDGVDYHFRTREEIDVLRGDQRYVVMEVRGDLLAVDVHEVSEGTRQGSMLYEGNPFVAEVLVGDPRLAELSPLSVFLSPLSREELGYLSDRRRHVDLPAMVAEIMRRKLLRRQSRARGVLAASELADIERRATSAYGELKLACRFSHVIPNHDGEDSDNWDAFYYPLGDARRAAEAFAALLEGGTHPCVEQWDETVVP